MKREQYAFWEYDQYPFVLSGVVVGKRDRNGRVTVKGYDGFRFLPIKLVAGERGKAASVQLETLRSQHRAAKAALDKAFNGKALAVAPFLKHCKRTSAYKNNE